MEPPYKIITWSVERAILTPRLTVDVRQYWPYAPYQEMIASLPYASRALLFFLSLAALTLMICGAPLDLRQVALLAGLFTLPFLVLMAGGVPAPKSITPAQFASYQVKMLPVLSLLLLPLAFIVLRRLPRLPLAFVLVIMTLFVGGYTLIGLVLDEQKRNAIQSMVQVAMIAYIFGLTLFIRVRSALRSRQKPVE